MIRRLLMPTLALAAWTSGCDDGGTAGPKPPPVSLPDEPNPTYGPGHLTVAQRGLALDLEDFAVLTPAGSTAGISVSELGTTFPRLVINQPYVAFRNQSCVDADEALAQLPRAQAEAFVADLETETGVRFDEIAVNVDLLTPARTSLFFVCYGEDKPRFDVVAHREALIGAFRDLAGMANVKHITVGLEMNRYYHLRSPEDRPLFDDYSNFVTLYREIYRTIKEENSAIQVGPGVSYAMFMRRTVPAIAEELDLEEDSLEAYYRAWQRTIEPLLKTNGGEVTADFIGVTMTPFQSEAPFDGTPRFVDAAGVETEDQDDIRAYFRRMPIFAGGLPVVIPQVDWASGAGSANLKARFLESLKNGLSGVNIAWLAWRRTSNLPGDVGGSNICAKYTESLVNDFKHPADFCTAGVVNESGGRTEVLDVLLQE